MVSQHQTKDLWLFLSSIIYITASSFSFYGQIYQNYKLKVQDYFLDFLVFNIAGYTFYTIYSSFGYFTDIPGAGTVVIADLIFAYHIMTMVFIQTVHYLIYKVVLKGLREEKTGQQVLWTLVIIETILTWSATIAEYEYWNNVLVLGYAKLVLIFIKCTLNAYWNYKRQSTVRWSINSIIFDLNGGVFQWPAVASHYRMDRILLNASLASFLLPTICYSVFSTTACTDNQVQANHKRIQIKQFFYKNPRINDLKQVVMIVQTQIIDIQALNQHSIQLFWPSYNLMLGGQEENTWPFIASIIYTTAWCISFYGQIYQNYKLKSVQGFSLDYLVFNISGYTFYTVYSTLGYFTSIKGAGTVVIADLVFVYHSVLMVIIQAIQCCIYERGQNKISKWSIAILAIIWSIIIIQVILSITNTVQNYEYWNPLTVLGYGKLVITLIKYTPPAYWNYKRKSTKGWSIFNIILDLVGGAFSFASGGLSVENGLNLIKVILAFITVSYDLLFCFQHYCLYRQKNEEFEQAGKPHLLNKQEPKDLQEN